MLEQTVSTALVECGRAELIAVSDQQPLDIRGNVYILRDRAYPEFGLLLYDQGWPGRWSLRFRDDHRSYYLVCLCCRVGNRDDQREFGKQVREVCEEKGIAYLFVRHAEHWSDYRPTPDGTFQVLEGNDLRSVLGTDQSGDNPFPFLDWRETSFLV